MESSRRGLRVGGKFTLGVAVLVLALMAVAGVGLYGVDHTNDEASRLFDDNVRTILLTAELSDGLHEIETASLQLILAATEDERATYAAELRVDLIPSARASIATARRELAPGQLERLDAIEAALDEFTVLLDSGALDARSVSASGADRAGLAEQTTAIFETVEEAAHELVEFETQEAAEADGRADDTYRSTLWMLAASVALSLVGGALIVLALSRSIVPRIRRYSDFAAAIAAGRRTEPLDVRGADELAELGTALNVMVAQRNAVAASGHRQAEFVDTLQVTSTEEEAHELIKRHIERSLPATSVVVMQRNNSANRLEAATSTTVDSEIASRLLGAEPRSCLSLRFARTHHEGGDEAPLLSCALCGGRDVPSTCEPLLVGGEVIGSVLVSHPQALDADADSRIKTSVAQAAPVLANLRNLALAEFRANNDSLTGLPNKRATDDTLKRMVAQANRSLSPLTAIMLDLDHFKQINDRYGHGKGDEVLAAVGAALRGCLRASDFAGRFGGEEFLVLLPDTNLDGARQVAEHIRVTVAAIAVPGIEREITVSLGVADLLEHAGNADGLVREADHALYAAKTSGRNRAVVAGTVTSGTSVADTDVARNR